MALVVIRSAPVLRQIRRIDGRAEKVLSHVVHRLRERIRHAIVAPCGRTLHERDVQPVIVRLGLRRVLTVVGVVRIGTAPVIGSGRRTGRNVLIYLDDEVRRRARIGNRRSRCRAGRFDARLPRWPAAECAFWRSRSIVVRLTNVTDGTAAGRMFGKTGAPACVGERLMPI